MVLKRFARSATYALLQATSLPWWTTSSDTGAALTAGEVLAGRLARGERLRFIVATDGSPFAQSATRFAGELARTLEAQVTLLAVIPGEEFLTRGRTILDEARQLLGALQEPAQAELLIGYADEEILEYASKHPADLIVIGAFGDRGATRFLIGSTAYRIVKHAPTSVLLVKDHPRQLQNFLLCTAGPDLTVVEVGGRLARRVGAQVTLLHVLPITVAMYLTIEDAVHIPLQALAEENVVRSKQLQEAVQHLRDVGVQGDVIVRRGYLPDTIFDVAQETKADLLVVGSQAHERHSRFLLGSVTDRVVKHAHRSVLVVRTRPTA